ncbi:IS3 family transposase [Neorhodopirellula lusitana]|uniref:IS3 family transposase n=1 Tax=Neorhodopirellula lusitana TaxID=445327 RepID=UPI00384E214A
MLKAEKGRACCKLKTLTYVFTRETIQRFNNKWDIPRWDSFFKSYKTEEVRNEQCETLEHATRGASEFIEHFYNSVRLQSLIGYRSPVKFEQSISKHLSLNPS